MDILVAKRRLRRLTIVTLILLTFEGWAGDAVNLFAIYPANHLSSITPYSYFQYIENVRGIGPILLAHEIVALFALGFALSTMLLALSMKDKWTMVSSVLGVLGVVSGLVGGLNFVLSWFSDNAASAQMGGSFIQSYAFFFLMLYFSK